jgi:serine/threonine protein kinase
MIVPTTVKGTKHEFTVGDKIASGDVADLYQVTSSRGGAVLKVAREKRDNDLLENEAVILSHLLPATQPRKGLNIGLTRLYYSFLISGHRANIIERADDKCVSLEAVIAAYPQGLDYRDMIWMYKRLITMLGFAHKRGIVHGAVLPPHFLINTENHGGKIVAWSYALNFEALMQAQAAAAAAPPDPTAAPGVDPSTSVDPYPYDPRGGGYPSMMDPYPPTHLGGPVSVPAPRRWGARAPTPPPDPPAAQAAPKVDVWALLKKNIYADDPVAADPTAPAAPAAPVDPNGMYVKAISVAYRDYYAPEILRKERPGPWTDLYMAAKCAVALLGGDVKTNQLPGTVPDAIRAFFQVSLLNAPSKRPHDAFQIHDDLESLLQKLVGPPKFREFKMPTPGGTP